MNKNEQILKLLLLMAFADKKYMEEEKERILLYYSVASRCFGFSERLGSYF